MKIFLILCAFGLINATLASRQLKSPKLRPAIPVQPFSTPLEGGEFETKLDHFTPQDDRTVTFVRKS